MVYRVGVSLSLFLSPFAPSLRWSAQCPSWRSLHLTKKVYDSFSSFAPPFHSFPAPPLHSWSHTPTSLFPSLMTRSPSFPSSLTIYRGLIFTRRSPSPPRTFLSERNFLLEPGSMPWLPPIMMLTINSVRTPFSILRNHSLSHTALNLLSFSIETQKVSSLYLLLSSL